ncbi:MULTISPECIES: DEAD/DEAH box helicase [unclassified Thioalkalivibrio]|uniref:DEAD/DEAH box helicase n=1 Tax=unclassified Thioalkalivibrio TaxID=2621013 RepID=UPI0003A4F764|nr:MULTISPECIES: DEAD/DEAH box helicase [unclassified Thioalkalivibrio]
MTEQGNWIKREGGFVLSPREHAGETIAGALINEGLAIEQADGLFVSDERVAGLAPWELRALGLPESSPFRLEIRGEGLIASSSFKLKSRLLRHDGKPVMGGQKDGALLKTGSRHYVLLDPMYSILQAIDEYEDLSPSDMDGRFARWAAIKAMLPEDSVVDQQLQTIQLVRADCFTLDVREDASFDPILLSRAGGADQDGRRGELEEALPETRQGIFAERFRRISDASGHYALGAGWYVVVPETTRRALSVVRQMQEQSATSRRAFIANPHAALRDELSGEFDEGTLEGLFVEQPRFLSGRVACLGEWHPKLCAYVSNLGAEWLPQESDGFTSEQRVGVLLGDQFVSLDLDDAPNLYSEMEAALASGRDSIEYQGIHLPANESNLETLGRFVTSKSKGAARDAREDESSEEEADRELVPILIDNLEELGYTVKRIRRTGQAGGIPGALETKGLYPHQRDGLYWLQKAWGEGVPGVLLADDMGLGKTLQMLAFLAWVQEQMDSGDYPRKPFLLVAPTGLLRNWQGEQERHLVRPGLGQPIEAFGSGLRELETEGLRRRSQRLQEADWVLTTYETLRDRIHTFLPVDWAVVGFDEAQKIKNPESRMTEMSKSLQSDFVVTITGTPVENSLSDLWSLMDASHAGLLGSLREFRERYQKPAEEEGDTGQARALRALLEEEVDPPAILRRSKDDHLAGLPEKSAYELREVMPPRQAEAYSVALHKGLQGRGTPGAVLEAIQQLRKISLLADNLDETGLTEDIVNGSARLRATMRALDAIHEQGEKALVFVEFLDLQSALIPYLEERYRLPDPPLRINGRIGGKDRQRAVNAFQSRPEGEFDVMLLSPKAGGVGLTLTAANHVIHLSRWWNPAVEDQCTDRVYRIGQEREVHIYYPMALHPDLGDRSFDVTLHHLLERKRGLSHQVMAPSQVTQDDLADLWKESAHGA